MASPAHSSSARSGGSSMGNPIVLGVDNASEVASHLLEHSFVIVHALSRDEVQRFRRDLLAAVHSSPEFKPGQVGEIYRYRTKRRKAKKRADQGSGGDENTKERGDQGSGGEEKTNDRRAQGVGGGFGALGHASSFHNLAVRKWRLLITKRLYPVFVALARKLGLPPATTTLQMMYDRVMHRMAGEKPTKESVHRDLPPKEARERLRGSYVFGGWIGASDSRVHLVPGSHLKKDMRCEEGGGGGGGGCRENATTAAKLGFAKLAKEEAKDFQQDLRSFDVPAGAALILLEDAVHAVVPSVNRKKDHLRLFHALCLSPDGQSHFSEDAIRGWMQEGAVPPLKSGQQPRMFPRLWTVNFRSRLTAWSQHLFPEEHLITKTVKTTVKDPVSGKRRRGPDEQSLRFPDFCPSLCDMRIPFTAYSEAEIKAYLPQKLEAGFWVNVSPPFEDAEEGDQEREGGK